MKQLQEALANPHVPHKPQVADHESHLLKSVQASLLASQVLVLRLARLLLLFC